MEPFHRRVGWAGEEFERFSGIELSAGADGTKWRGNLRIGKVATKLRSCTMGTLGGAPGSLIGAALAFSCSL